MIIRHGDLLIKSIDKLLENAIRQEGNILVYGEVTNHSHRIMGGEVFKVGEAIYFTVANKGKLSHEEHKSIDLDKGTYAVLRTREYDYTAKKAREVRD
ncbi:MAG: hypothetical protein WC549_00320 [Actinomycetota bacterium]